MFQKLKTFLKLKWVECINSKYYNMAEPYIICGPSLLGWLISVYRYDKSQLLFKAGFYHLSLFLIYLASYIFIQIIAWVNPFEFQNYLSYVLSFLALGYLYFSITFLVKVLKAIKENKSIELNIKLQNLIDRLSL